MPHSVSRSFMMRASGSVDSSECMGQSSTYSQSSGSIQDPSCRRLSVPSQPWLEDDGTILWTQQRIVLAKVISTQTFEFIMGVLICFNIILVIWETDETAKCEEPEWRDDMLNCPYLGANVFWLRVTNYLLLLIYTVECSVRLYVQRRAFFDGYWNNLDLFIVVSGVLGELVGDMVNLAFLKIFRLARLMRAFRVLIAFRELYLMLHGFMSAMKAIFWGSFLMFALLIVWSIVLVEFVHPINVAIDYEQIAPGCARCPRAFSTVVMSTITLFQQIITGDSWGLVTVPVIERDVKTAVIFVLIVVTVSLGLTNLILAVIVECASEARENDLLDKLKHKEADSIRAKQDLFKQCQAMDVDSSGALSLEELTEGFDTIPSFRDLLKLMDVEKDELKSIFRLLDQDGSGDVSYDEFCDQLHKIRTRDTRTMVMFMKLTLQELKVSVETNLEVSRTQIQEKTEMNSRTLARIVSLVEACCQEGQQGRGGKWGSSLGRLSNADLKLYSANSASGGATASWQQSKDLDCNLRNSSEEMLIWDLDCEQGSTNSTATALTLPIPPQQLQVESSAQAADAPCGPSTSEDRSTSKKRSACLHLGASTQQPSSAERMEEEIELLKRRLSELATMKAMFSRRSEDQKATLAHQAEFIAAIDDALQRERASDLVGAAINPDNALLENIATKLGPLRRGVDEQLATLALDVRCHMEDESAALSESTVLSTSLRELLHQDSPWKAWEARERHIKQGAHTYGVGELAEVVILDDGAGGTYKGDWIKCRIVGPGTLPETYDVHVLPTTVGKAAGFSSLDLANISPEHLRKGHTAYSLTPREVLPESGDVCRPSA